MKEKERDQAVKLRKEKGLSIGEIAQLLSVSKGSVSLWVRTVPLTFEQKQKLCDKIEKNREEFSKKFCSHLLGNTYIRDKHIKIRKGYQEEGRKKAKKREWLHTAGCMLYWAEGSKKRNCVELTNSDPFMLKLFILFLKEVYKVKRTSIKIHVQVHLNNGLTKREIEIYWLKELNLPESSLRKTMLNKYSNISKRKKVGKLPYGTCNVIVSSTEIAQKILGAIQEYGNFSRSAWLF